MRQDRPGLVPAHRLVQVLLVHQVSDRDAEPDIGEIHHHQRQHEVRHREAEQADEGDAVVTPTVLMGRRVDADRKRDGPGEEDRDGRQQDRQPEPVAHHLAHRQPVLEGIAEIAVQHAADPAQVADVLRLIEAVAFAQYLDLGQVRVFPQRLEFGHVAFEIVARRQFDDGEDQDRDQEQRRDHGQDASGDVAEHGYASP